MEKIVVIPDSFKGTLSSQEVCLCMKRAIERWYPKAELLTIPIADGGEGSTDAFLAACGGTRIPVRICGPQSQAVSACYGVLPDGTAVIEAAAAAGLSLAGPSPNPELTTTYGVGQLMRHALLAGCRDLILCLGGSATNDGGCGAAAALGMRFLQEDGTAYLPVGGTLDRLQSIDPGELLPQLQHARIRVMCDVDNPLCGPQGASVVFGPQKGADPHMVQRLDKNLQHLAEIIRRDLHIDIANLPGAGAAGGMGGGMAAFAGAVLQSGIDAILDAVRFEEAASHADIIFTGEGRLDGQSLHGKAVTGIARRAKQLGIPVVAVVGDIEDPIDAIYPEGICAVFSTNRQALPFSQICMKASDHLFATMDAIMRLLHGMKIS